MKNILSSILLLCFIASTVFAQSESKVFNSKSLVVYGIDFSKARMIGSEGFTDPPKIKSYFFNNWNDLLLEEKEKYDFGKAFNKSDVQYELDAVKKRNETPKIEDIVIETGYTLEESEARKMVRNYKSDRKEGVGLVFIVESFSKAAEAGTMYVTFFDIASKDVLLIKKMSGPAGGFGFRNYWAKSIYNVLKECEKEYPRWIKDYNKQQKKK